MKTIVSAPSNIALIKYMGKAQDEKNQGVNRSLSYTLSHLKSFVRLTSSQETQWQALVPDEEIKEKLWPLHMGPQGQKKFLEFFRYLQAELDVPGHFLIESVNNFPADAGVASSASSFAALTLAAAKASERSTTLQKLSSLSRKGSGSSCRSFFEPWAIWDGEGARGIELPYADLIHLLVIVSEKKKLVSSSEAHLRVLSSPNFTGRRERAEKRLNDLLEAMRAMKWQDMKNICWDEFMDMHQLFETSQPAFSYMTIESQQILDDCQKVWNYKGDGPLITMDAGPNVHLLFRQDQKNMAQRMTSHFAKHFSVLSSLQ